MLFSQPELADWISDTFECAWESVRDVPRVTVDFGGERVVRRTLHGNVVTWICDAQGRALDAVAGLYDAERYSARLEQAALLAWHLANARDDERASVFHDYHARQAERIATGRAPLVVERSLLAAASKELTERRLELAIVDPEAGAGLRAASKRGTERPLERVLSGGEVPVALSKFATERPLERAVAQRVPLDVPRPSGEKLAAPGVRADKGLLAQDTSLGETRFRPQIHLLFALTGSAPYGELTKRVYREVLHVDLDDPWLGLSDLLFADYPFDV